MTHPHGYAYGHPNLPPSSVTLADLEALKESVLWSPEDEAAMRRAGEILIPQTEAILDVWYGFVGAHPHLVSAFGGSDGTPDMAYLGAVRDRFAQWIDDLCNRRYDRVWLAYQEEIGRRHHLDGKNQTDEVASSSSYVPLRDLIAFISPITLTIRPFLQRGTFDDDELQTLHNAWLKSVTLTASLWARRYNEELW